MNFGEQTVWCRCGKPYKVYSHYAGDQSACPSCRAQAEQNMRQQMITIGTGWSRPDTDKRRPG